MRSGSTPARLERELYWATTTDRPINLRSGFDSQLGGAFIIDPKGAVRPDRIFVIGEWDDRQRRVDDTPQPGDPHVFVINGQSWPYTEKLREEVGREVRWRVINMSLLAHPMHLHGFYFDVRGQGNGLTHTAYPSERTRSVVTQNLPIGATLDMAWVPSARATGSFTATSSGTFLRGCVLGEGVARPRGITRCTTRPRA